MQESVHHLLIFLLIKSFTLSNLFPTNNIGICACEATLFLLVFSPDEGSSLLTVLLLHMSRFQVPAISKLPSSLKSTTTASK